MARGLDFVCVVTKVHHLTEVHQEHLFLIFHFTGIKCYAMNYELALSFIFQALRFAELAVNMNLVSWFAGIYRQPDALFYYAHVDIYIDLSEVYFNIKLI